MGGGEAGRKAGQVSVTLQTPMSLRGPLLGLFDPETRKAHRRDSKNPMAHSPWAEMGPSACGDIVPSGSTSRSAVTGVCRSRKACRLLVRKGTSAGAVGWAGTHRTGRASPGGGGGRSLGFESRKDSVGSAGSRWYGLARRRVRPTPNQLELDPGKAARSVAQTFRRGVARGSGVAAVGWPSPVIGVLAQRRLVRVVGGGSGSEARMRRSRCVLGVEAVL